MIPPFARKSAREWWKVFLIKELGEKMTRFLTAMLSNEELSRTVLAAIAAVGGLGAIVLAVWLST